MEGFVTLGRKMLEWEWYRNNNTKSLFIHMIFRANWKEGKFEGKIIPRGSFVSSIEKLSNEVNLTPDKIRTAIKNLENTGEVTKQSTNKYTVYTVVNYNEYQIDPKQSPSESQTEPIQIPTIEKGNKEKREEGNNTTRNYQEIITLYNSLCKSYLQVVKISDRRKKAIAARMNQGYTVDDFKSLFAAAERSSFLKGANKNDWKADFDWLIKDSSMAKVLEGRYEDRRTESGGNTGNNAGSNEKGLTELAIEAGLGDSFDGF